MGKKAFTQGNGLHATKTKVEICVHCELSIVVCLRLWWVRMGLYIFFKHFFFAFRRLHILYEPRLNVFEN